MHDCHSKYIVSSWGAFLDEPNICICMEFMDKGSFDGIYKKIGSIDIEVVGKVALSVLEGLTYLYDAHRIIHRGVLRVSPCIKHIILYITLNRHQTVQYPLQFSRRHQTLRLRCLGRAHQFDRQYIRGHIHLHECTSRLFSLELGIFLTLPVMYSPSAFKVRNTPSNQTSGPSEFPSSSSPTAGSHFPTSAPTTMATFPTSRRRRHPPPPAAPRPDSAKAPTPTATPLPRSTPQRTPRHNGASGGARA